VSDRDSQATVSRWVDAFNARDLDAMLTCLDVEVDFHPLQVAGLERSYRGHAGVRRWFAALQRRNLEYRIAVSALERTDDGGVLAAGALGVDGQNEIAPFCGLHRLSQHLITDARHY
jgi:hypothetical protein